MKRLYDMVRKNCMAFNGFALLYRWDKQLYNYNFLINMILE